MINKYSDTNIKNVNVKTTKKGIQYVKSIRASMDNSNVTYNLVKSRDRKNNTDIYIPKKKNKILLLLFLIGFLIKHTKNNSKR